MNQRSKGLIHFVLAALLLGGSWIALGQVVKAMGWFLTKEPVPWPADVVVDKDKGFVLTSLPKMIGDHYEFVQPVKISDDDKESLSIGGPLDKARFTQRQSNWLFSGYYYDNRFDGSVKKPRKIYQESKEPGKEKPAGDELNLGPERNGLWVLQIYYYTGVVDAMAHVPEVCGEAAGLMINPATIKPFPLGQPVWLGPDPGGRNTDVTFARIQSEYSRTPGAKRLDYYLIVVNGSPQTDRDAARIRMVKDLTSRHSYYAKIQFAPLVVTDPDKADEAAGEFVKAFLPQVLKMLPSAQVVKDINSSAKR